MSKAGTRSRKLAGVATRNQSPRVESTIVDYDALLAARTWPASWREC